MPPCTMTDVFDYDDGKDEFEFDENDDNSDEFEFDEQEETAPTPKIKLKKKKGRAKDYCDGSVSSSVSQASTATTSNVSPKRPNGVSTGFRPGRTKHSRSKVQKQQQQKLSSQAVSDTGDTTTVSSRKKRPRHQENNGLSPSKHVRFSGNTKKGKPTKADSDHQHKRQAESGDESSISSSAVSSVVSARKSTSEDGAASNAKKKAVKPSVGSGVLPANPFAKRKKKSVPNVASIATTNKTDVDDFDFHPQSTPIEAPLGDGFSTLGSNRFSSGGTSSVSLSEQLQSKLQQHDRQQKKLYQGGDDNDESPANLESNSNGLPEDSPIIVRKVRGAGKDAFALADSGAQDMLHDDCGYLCSAILAAANSGTGIKVLSPVTVDAVSELAALLSTTKTRATLFQNKGNECNASLEGVLDVLAHATNAMVQLSQCDSSRLDILFRRLQNHRGSAAERKKRGVSGLPKLEDAESEITRILPRPQNRQNNIVTSYYAVLLIDALAAIVHFLSWDCTVTNKASAFCKNSRGAQLFRRSILQHDCAIQAIVRIIRQADPIVESILLQQPSPCETQDACDRHDDTLTSRLLVENTKKTASTEPLLPPSPVRLTHATTGCQAKPTTNSSIVDSTSVSLASSIENESVASIATADDPTKAGRRRRKRRPGAAPPAVGPPLRTIAEEEEGGLSGRTPVEKHNMSPPRSPPREIFQQNHEAVGAKTGLSFTSMDMYSPSKSPPRTTRPNGWRPLGASNNLEDDGSAVSSDSAFLKIHDRLNLAKGRFVVSPSKACRHLAHKCHLHRDLPKSFGGTERAGCAQSLALAALRRIIAGKDESDAGSCLGEIEEEGHHDQNNDDSADFSPTLGKKKPAAAMNEEEMLQNNPLLETNRLLGSSGAIPILSQGISETLAAILLEVERCSPCGATSIKSSSANKTCPACLKHLQEKFQGLATLVDGACLMNDDNRAEFCRALGSLGPEGRSDSNSGGVYLVGSLVLSLNTWMRLMQSGKLSRKVVAIMKDMKLSVLQTLTSLTHDNTASAEQLALSYRPLPTRGPLPQPKDMLPWNGVQVICHVLYQIATGTTVRSADCKASYDSCTFCLNTLANIVGDEIGGDVRRILASLAIPTTQDDDIDDGSSPVLFLSWLTKWLVGQTETFQDSIMNGSFGGSASNSHSDRGLEKSEEEHLVTAGNGCVLLACLLMDPPKGGNLEETTSKLREVILAEMPMLGCRPSGTKFIQNTLRAFSNLLYISMGDLSVAVVAPIRRLITQLEKIQVLTED